MKHYWLFLREMIMQPSKIGAIAPSSKQLARKMVLPIDINRAGLIAELGPGTGVVTKALLEKGAPEKNIIIIEHSKKLARHLKIKYPNLNVIEGDALHLTKYFSKTDQPIRYIVSSLPLRNLSEKAVARINKQMLDVLSDDGLLIQYTYSWWSNQYPPILAPFEKIQSYYVWWNLPPARVDVFKKIKVQ